MKLTRLTACVSLIAIAGCEVPVMMAAEQNQGQMKGFSVEFPAAMLVRFSDGQEEFLTGTLLGHANGNADYAVVGPNWGKCKGEVKTSKGVNSFACENGMKSTMDIGVQKVAMSGVNIVSGNALDQTFITAFGWGNYGNETSVRAALDKQ